MGLALKELGWARETYLVSTKFFWGIVPGVNTKNTLNRKYLRQAMDRSLERFGLDFIDLVFCHRSDPETPIEETVFTMSELVSSGKAHYWGTSEWSAQELMEAYEIAERYHLHKPTMEQPQYHLFHRERLEEEYDPLLVLDFLVHWMNHPLQFASVYLDHGCSIPNSFSSDFFPWYFPADISENATDDTFRDCAAFNELLYASRSK